MVLNKIIITAAISLFLLTFPKVHYSQSFAPTGAVWHYTYFAQQAGGYLQILSEGDTLIYGKASKKLKKIQYQYDFIDEKHDTFVLGYEYVYSENNKVFRLTHDSFYILYDFNAVVDSTWVVGGDIGGCNKTGRVIVDSVSSLTIGPTTLKEIHSSPVGSSHWAFYDKIVERIGGFKYMFPDVTHYCLIVEEGYQLRCYEDTVIGFYETGVSESCDYISDYIPGVNVPQDVNSIFTVSPTLISEKVHIFFNPQTIKDVPKVNIIDLMGKKLLGFELTNNTGWYYLNDLSSGVYLVLIRGETYRYNKLIVKP